MKYILLFLMPLFSFSQTEIVSNINFGTSIDFTNQPVSPQSDFSKSQVIYYQSDLKFKGLINQNRYVTSFSSISLENSTQWIVKMGTTDLVEFGNGVGFINQSELTEVFNGSIATGSGEVIINFTTPYNYTGEQNLVIQVEEVSPGAASSSLSGFKGREKNITTYNLARMNKLLQGMKDTEFEIFHGDTLLNQWDMLNEMNPAKKVEFDAIVANPPFSLRWEPDDTLADDFRFKSYGLAPKSAADFAFLLHGFHFLGKEGVMTIILPHGVFFRGGAEVRIRTKLLKDNHIDTVIGLPSNLFYSTGIPVCILVLKKCKKQDDVLFINASEQFDKGKRQNTLGETHLQQIIETYQFRQERERFSRKVSMNEIENNGYNLNISRYTSTSHEEIKVNLEDVHVKLIEINERIKINTDKHNEFLKELGLPQI